VAAEIHGRRRPEQELVAAGGPWGGPVFACRGAGIRCAKGGHVRGLVKPGHPLDGHTFGVPGTITGLVGLWIKGRRLPDHMRAVKTPRG
jgi:hypothetical protein